MRFGKTDFTALLLGLMLIGLLACDNNEESSIEPNKNYVLLLDLSERLSLHNNQSERDQQLIHSLQHYTESNSINDELSIVLAPERTTEPTNILKFNSTTDEVDLSTLYEAALAANENQTYYNDVWKYLVEEFEYDYVNEIGTENYLIILTDGYSILGKQAFKLQQIKNKFPNLQVILMEANPRDNVMEWNRLMVIWEDWFRKIGVENYTLIEKGSLEVEIDQLKNILDS